MYCITKSKVRLEGDFRFKLVFIGSTDRELSIISLLWLFLVLLILSVMYPFRQNHMA